MARADYIFIGGSYRTGTDLVRNVLNASDEVAICGETHFLGASRTGTDLLRYVFNRSNGFELPGGVPLIGELPDPGSRQEFARIGDIATEAGARRVVDHIYHNQPYFWRWLPANVDKEEFLQKFLATDRSERSLLELVMSLYAGDKPVRGEKTPAHIAHVTTLFEWFPNARFIHMFRDPRAIFISQRKKASNSQKVSPVHRLFRRSQASYEIFMSFSVIVHWLRVVQLHHHYQQLYPGKYYLLKFEDLVGDPDIHLEKLCNFLEIELTGKMLQRRVVNSSFVSSADQVAGFDSSIIGRWRQLINPVTNRWFVLACGKHLGKLGYQL